MGELVAGLVQSGERVYAHEVDGPWNDIGVFDGFLEAHRGLTSRDRRTTLEAAGNVLEGVVYVHPQAQAHNSRLKDVVICAGAAVRSARLERCVVQPGAVVEGRSLTNSLVTSRGEDPLWE